MKKSLLMAVLTALPLSTPLAWAEEARYSDKDKKPETSMTDKGQRMPMGMMQEKMLQMHEQMHKIMQSKDIKERERLMQEHSKMMQDNMSMMQGMMGGGMMGPDMMGGDAKGGKMDSGMKNK